MTEAEPARARPRPSRMDFLPSAMTSAGMSAYFVPTTNSLTCLVRSGALGNSLRSAGNAGAGDAAAGDVAASAGETFAPPRVNAERASPASKKSRRFMEDPPKTFGGLSSREPDLSAPDATE